MYALMSSNDSIDLNVSENNIKSVHQSIHMIVPLSMTLTALDMRDNDICDNINYCTEGHFIHTLIHTYTHIYKYSYIHVLEHILLHIYSYINMLIHIYAHT